MINQLRYELNKDESIEQIKSKIKEKKATFFSPWIKYSTISALDKLTV